MYYSRTGTVRQVAEQLAAKTGWSLAEIQDVRSRAGLIGGMRSLLDNLLPRRPQYRYGGQALAECKHAVVLAPVWAGRLAAPMRAFLEDQEPFEAKLSAICVMGGRGGFGAIEEISCIAGKVPSPALVLRRCDVVSGLAQQDLLGFVAESVAVEQRADAAKRPAWLSPREA